jgi:predicted metal-binding membrane protein
MQNPDRLETALRNDRLIVLAALAGMALLAWAYMLHEARGFERTQVCRCFGMAMAGPDTKAWSATTIAPLFLMWAEMMVAMMIPSAAPMILTFARVNRQRREQARPFVPAGLLLLGYLLVWCAFSLFAALAQWALHGATLLSPMMTSRSQLLGAALLISAGIFQWTPWKRACLSHCRSPLNFLLTQWREGKMGALAMGGQHGAYCIACCWLLMLLLFVAGVMNMLWVAAITLLVLLERILPHRMRLDLIVGVVLVAWGIWMMAAHSS